MECVFAYISTNDKVIITKLEYNIKQMKLYLTSYIWGSKGVLVAKSGAWWHREVLVD